MQDLEQEWETYGQRRARQAANRRALRFFLLTLPIIGMIAYKIWSVANG